MTDNDHLERINALTRNARQTWFALLAALVFVGITLMGVEHIDFYGVDRATELPLVSVEVPTRYFFVAAPILIAAIYGYFHLYLIRLWIALGDAPTRLNGIKLGDAITPWLVSDAALHVRSWIRRDNSTTQRALDWPAMILNLLLAWVFGLVVLGLLWWVSLPARTLYWITTVSAASLLVSVFAGWASFLSMVEKLRRNTKTRDNGAFLPIGSVTGMIALSIVMANESYQRTSGDIDRLAPLDMADEEIVARPKNWLPFGIARNEFWTSWCRRNLNEQVCDKYEYYEPRFEQDLRMRRTALLSGLNRPWWDTTGPYPENSNIMDFRNANLGNSFIPGVELRYTDMRGANLYEADLEGASLGWANLLYVNLSGTQLSNVDFSGVDLDFSLWSGIGDDSTASGTVLNNVINHGGALRNLDLRKVKFDRYTDFRNTFFDGSVELTEEFRNQMGDLCQTTNDVLSDKEFYGRWRGWVELAPPKHKNLSLLALEHWLNYAPRELGNIEPVPPDDPSCKWKSGPMPGAE